MNVKVTRLEQYPPEEPNGWAVGFLCTCTNNDRGFYTDTIVSFDDADSDEDAVNVALDSLKESITDRCEALDAKSPLLGIDVTDRL